MYSGGESFRVNFAIRIALSRLLARKAGARLQTLIIDEGFGTQDAKGRERLVEAIETIRDEFSLILAITHIEERKRGCPDCMITSTMVVAVLGVAVTGASSVVGGVVGHSRREQWRREWPRR